MYPRSRKEPKKILNFRENGQNGPKKYEFHKNSPKYVKTRGKRSYKRCHKWIFRRIRRTRRNGENPQKHKFERFSKFFSVNFSILAHTLTLALR